jgi:hypothetical protein
MDEPFTTAGLSDAAAEAAKIAQDRRLRSAIAGLARADTGTVRTALTAPREFLAGAGVQVPGHLEVTIIRGDPVRPAVPARFGPDFEFFSLRQLDCRTYWVAKKDENGNVVGYEEQEICWGFEITPRFLPGGPIA